jgi:hypothetical protein
VLSCLRVAHALDVSGYLTAEERAYYARRRAEAAKIVVPYKDVPWRDLTDEQLADRAEALANWRRSQVIIIPADDPDVARVMAELDALEEAKRGGQPNDIDGRQMKMDHSVPACGSDGSRSAPRHAPRPRRMGPA